VTWIAWTLAYLVVHLLVYALLLRQIPRFTHERVIFAYHAVSDLAWAVILPVGALAGLWPGQGPAGWLAVVGLHGIYSLTFLSLWSLASGGYSIGILENINAGGEAASLKRSDLEQIGEDKQHARLRGIEGLGLIRSRGESLELTMFGACVASVLGTVAALFAVRESG
jgi:hypothetical protein